MAGDNLVLHRAIAAAPAGGVIVGALEGDTAVGHWGELMCIAARAAGLHGIVISGSVRDLTAIHARRFPVFHRGVGPRPAAKFHEGELGAPVQIEGVTISPGDLVVADADGVVLVPQALVERVHADVATLERRESEIVPLLERGRSTLDVLGLS